MSNISSPATETNASELPASTETIPRLRSACLAPATQMYLSPDGFVRACCRNFTALGHIGDQSLSEIWNGEARRTMVQRLGNNDYPVGCQPCGVETRVEGRDHAYPSHFDRHAPEVDAAPGGIPKWPTRIEFNLSNTCNLMCVQCNSLLSSMIRAHRDHLPPLPHWYDDAFFDELRRFIPHLHDTQFAGGEPFLARENFRVWSLIEELNPTLPCSVVTNATQWNSRIERVALALRMGFTFSIDGITGETYEAIRINSDFGVVMQNIPRYIEIARANDVNSEVNFCLMRQNYHEFGDLLLWAESFGMPVNVCVVRSPENCSLASLSRQEIRTISEDLDAIDGRVRPQLEVNERAWTTELDRIRGWAGVDEETHSGIWWSERWSTEPIPVVIGRTHSSLGLVTLIVLNANRGSDLEGEARALAEWSGDGVHQFEIDYVPNRDTEGDRDHLILSIGPEIAELLKVDQDRAVGQPLAWLLDQLPVSLGPLLGIEPIESSEQRVETEIALERGVIRSVILPIRNGRGRMEGATVQISVRTH